MKNYNTPIPKNKLKQFEEIFQFCKKVVNKNYESRKGQSLL